MLNGKTTFHSNHTFLYLISLHYYVKGFFNLEWNTPTKTLQYNTTNWFDPYQAIHALYEPCFLNIGDSGDYTLKLNYLNLKSTYWGNGHPMQPYLIIMDLELT